MTDARTVVVLLSDKRSGSTMVQTELCRHPQVQHVGYSPHTYNETHHWLKSACLLKSPPELFAGGKRYRGYGPRASTRRYLIDCIRGNVPEFEVPTNDEKLVFEGWEALCERYAEPVFFEKSPQIVHHWAALDLLFQWIERTGFSVRVVGLVRNPLAVAASAEKAFSTPPYERQFGWAEGCRNLLSAGQILGPDRFRMVRYEDLVASPSEEFGKLCRFIGVEPDGNLGSAVHAQSTSKWIEDPAFTLELEPSVRRIATRFGYGDEELENPHGTVVRERVGGEARIRVAAARVFQRWLKPIALGLWQRK
jgi:hypothetical protein